MHHHQLLIFFAALIFAYGLISNLAEKKSVTGPMVFVMVGVLGVVLDAEHLQIRPDVGPVKLVAELALVLILFTDASLIKLDALRSSPSRVPTRLLLIGLPLTMIFGTVLGLLMFDGVETVAILLMALILSPTDAALGQVVVKSESVPLNIRQSISVESGLNDGIALPPILVCLALLGAEAGQQDGGWLGYLVKQLTLGPLVGLLVGWIGGKLIQLMTEKGWMSETFQQISALPLAILSYACAESVGGNGFIAAFVAGLGLTLGTGSSQIRHKIQEFAEAEGAILMLVVFLIFGLALIPVAVPYWGMRELIYALASLTVIRMVPVAISLAGTKLDWQTKAFIGWFGPRGIASVLYLLMSIAAIGFTENEQIMSVIVLTVTLSIFAHGITAAPLSKLYERHVSDKT